MICLFYEFKLAEQICWRCMVYGTREEMGDSSARLSGLAKWIPAPNSPNLLIGIHPVFNEMLTSKGAEPIDWNSLGKTVEGLPSTEQALQAGAELWIPQAEKEGIEATRVAARAVPASALGNETVRYFVGSAVETPSFRSLGPICIIKAARSSDAMHLLLGKLGAITPLRLENCCPIFSISNQFKGNDPQTGPTSRL